jgi:cystathionine beta-lyase/cystathionine gamma-synthase
MARPDSASTPSLSTRAIHAADEPRRPGAPVVPPIVQSATFHSGGPDDEGLLLYTRDGTNPNQVRVGKAIAALEGMEAGLAMASGMAAIALSCLSLARAGSHVVASRHLYGTTRRFMDQELPARGVAVTYVDPDVEGAWEAALRPETALLYLEMPTNPVLRVFDPREAARAAREAGIPLVMDVTFASPVNLRAGSLGADLVVHSATKYLGGHSDLIAGVVAGSTPLVEKVSGLLKLYGPSLDPHTAWLLERGMRTLAVRVDRQNRSALSLGRWFEEHPAVEAVLYPGLPSHPDHDLAAELMDGFGGMLSVVLRGGGEAAEAFCRRLRLAAVAPSLGGVETLVSLPELTSHRTMTDGERRAVGIGPGFVRISVGLEGLEDLEAEFAHALEGTG